VAYFSYNQLALFKACPLKFKLLRMDRVAANQPNDGRKQFIGDLLQALMERFYKERIWAEGPAAGLMLSALIAETALATEQANQAKNQTVYPWNPGEREHWLATTAATIPKIIQTIKDERLLAPRVETELEIEIPMPTGDVLVGRCDFVLHDSPEHITLLDGKGGGTLGAHVKADQLRFYQLGILVKYKRLPARTGFWWFRHGKVVWKKTPAHILPKFVEGMRVTIDGLRAREYPAKPGRQCNYCDALPWCSAGQNTVERRANKMLDSAPDDPGVHDVSL
jgi:hypothetical protein